MFFLKFWRGIFLPLWSIQASLLPVFVMVAVCQRWCVPPVPVSPDVTYCHYQITIVTILKVTPWFFL